MCTLTYRKGRKRIVLALFRASNAAETYEIPWHLFRVDWLILPLVAQLHHDWIGEEDLIKAQDLQYQFKSSLESWTYEDSVAQWVSELFELPQNNFARLCNSFDLRYCKSYTYEYYLWRISKILPYYIRSLQCLKYDSLPAKRLVNCKYTTKIL